MRTYNKVADLRGSRGVSNKWVTAHEATIKKLEAYAKRRTRPSGRWPPSVTRSPRRSRTRRRSCPTSRRSGRTRSSPSRTA
ncbi:hypothetical protein ACFQ3Z_15965 [Streptomyces nogalater]